MHIPVKNSNANEPNESMNAEWIEKNDAINKFAWLYLIIEFQKPPKVFDFAGKMSHYPTHEACMYEM